MEFYKKNSYPTKKVMYYMDLTGGISYKVLDDSTGFELLKDFYNTAISLGDDKKNYFVTKIVTKNR